jgi:hypothetical protein
MARSVERLDPGEPPRQLIAEVLADVPTHVVNG